MTRIELDALLNRKFSEEVGDLTTDDFSDAIDAAERDTWSLPVTTSFKITWVLQRAERHLFYTMSIKTAGKFHAKKFVLGEKWEHWQEMYEKADKAFDLAIEENPAEFAGVSPTHMFGTKIDAGFQYDEVGRDTTYSEDNTTIFKPTQSD